MRETFIVIVAACLVMAACTNKKQSAKEALENVAVKYYPPVNGLQCAVAVNTDIERMPMACAMVTPETAHQTGTFTLPSTVVQ